MAYLNDNVLDYGVAWAGTATNRLDICSTEPATYAEATSTYSLGTANPTIGSPADGSPSGRMVQCGAISDGAVTATGTAGFWAWSRSSDSTLVAAGSLSATQVVTSGNTFTLTAHAVTIPDPA